MGRTHTKNRTSQGRTRTIPARITVQRRRGRESFIACVRVGNGMRRKKVGRRIAFYPFVKCVTGKNPRAALAAAMREVASSMDTRTGAFSGFWKRG